VVDRVAWYNFRNDGDNQFESEQNFGVVRSDLRLKPAYRTLATVGRELDGMTFKEQIEVSDGMYAFRFGDDTRETVVICSPRTGRVVTFDAAADAKIVNGVGESIESLRQGNRYTITLDVGFPAYISGKSGFTFKLRKPMVQAALERSSVRAGGSIEITFTPAVDAPDWELPYGWEKPKRVGTGKYRITAPAESPTGRVELYASVKIGANRLRMPVTLSVTSAKIRI
jgi:hypothetical protein